MLEAGMTPTDKEHEFTARFEALETRAAHQDQVIEDLNGTLTAQWAVIDGLKRQLSLLQERLTEAEERVATTPPPQRPPHY